MHQVPLGIQAGPGLSEKIQDQGGGRVQEPSGMDGAGPKTQELSDSPPPKLLNAPLKEKAGEEKKENIRGAAGLSFICSQLGITSPLVPGDPLSL